MKKNNQRKTTKSKTERQNEKKLYSNGMKHESQKLQNEYGKLRLEREKDNPLNNVINKEKKEVITVKSAK